MYSIDLDKRLKPNSLVNLAAFVIVIAGVKAAGALITPFLLAVFLTVAFLPLLLLLESKGVPGGLCLFLIITVLVGVWTLIVMLLGTTLGDFSQNVPAYQVRLREIVVEAWKWLQKYGVEIDKAMLEGVFDPGKLMRMVATALNSLGGILKNAFIILLMFTFLILEASGIPQKIQAIRVGHQGALDSYNSIISGINKYLVIKSLTSFITGSLIFLLLKFQGVDFPVLWGMLAFLLNFIPNIGSLIAAVPPVLLAMIQFGVGQALITAFGFLTVNTLIGSILEPKIMGQGVGLSTLVVFLSLIFWGWVLGPVGMLLSVPLTMAIKIALAEYDSTRWIAILLSANKEVTATYQLADKAEE